MKKLILAAAALAISFSASAQFGIVAGVTTPSSDINTAIEDFKTMQVDQYHAGIVYRIGLPFGFSIVPGVVYNMKGATLAKNVESSGIGGGSINWEGVTVETKTGYLEVPVQARWGIGGDLVGVFALVEPFVGYAITTETLASAKDQLTQEVLDQVLNKQNDTAKQWDGLERLEYGVSVGAGVRVLGHLDITGKLFWNFGNMYNENGEANPNVQIMYQNVKDQKCAGIAASAILYF